MEFASGMASHARSPSSGFHLSDAGDEGPCIMFLQFLRVLFRKVYNSKIELIKWRRDIGGRFKENKTTGNLNKVKVYLKIYEDKTNVFLFCFFGGS